MGIWLAENDGTKFWLKVLTELKNRGLNDIFITSVEGLKGFQMAISCRMPLFSHPAGQDVDVGPHVGGFTDPPEGIGV